MDNQKFFLYLALAFVLYMIWLTWQSEQTPPPAAQPSLEQTRDAAEQAAANPEDLPEGAEPLGQNQADFEVPASTRPASRSQQISVKTDALEVVIDARGGDIRQLDLPTYPVSLDQQDQPFRLLHSDSRTYIAQSGLQHDKINGKAITGVAPTHHDTYSTKAAAYELGEGQDSLEVKLFWSGDNNVHVEKIFTFYRDSFFFDITHKVINQGSVTWAGRQYQQLRHSPISAERSWLRLPTYTGTAYYDGTYHKHSFDDVNEEPINMKVRGGWVAMLQHYFVSAWVADEDEENRFYSKAVNAAGEQQLLIGLLSPSKIVPAKTHAEFTRRLYAGPKIQPVPFCVVF